MLVELTVENYAVIEKARVRFHRGLNLLTGETGSGKSIVVDALGLLLGDRASPEMIRTGASRARVSGIFEVADSPALAKLLEDAGIRLEDGELLVEREIQTGGKSRAFVGNRPATAALLKELAAYLADIHGQHDQQQLFSPAVQCEMVDAFAGAGDLVNEVSEAFRQWKFAAAELEDLERTAQEKLRLADLWSFQRKEIEAIAPKPGEDADLDNERRVLRNVVRLQELAGGAYAALYENPESAYTQVASAAKRLEELARVDQNAQELLSQLQPAVIALAETARSLGHYLEKLEADPARLEDVEDRLAALERLKRKYGASIEQVLAFLDEVRTNLSGVETADDRRNRLLRETAAFAQAYESTARRLSDRRKEAAGQLGKRIEQELAALAMEKTQVRISVVTNMERAAWTERGSDTVAFLIAPNVGEELKPLEKIASGGELSRVALALKTCVSASVKPSAKRTSAPRTLVFDEVDAGVGGGAAEAVGRRLKKLSGSNQVICVTHLPQIAGFADHHYYVDKHSEHGRTVATIEELAPDARTREIGRMLSGERITQEALRHAEQLLKMAAK